MKDYNIEATIPKRAKNEFVNRTRQQAFNVLLGHLLTVLPAAIILDVLIYYSFGLIAFPIFEGIAICYASYQYACALIEFTYQDREILHTRYENAPQKQTEHTYKQTLIPMAHGNGQHILDVTLTDAQLEHLASTALETRSLTINYLEGLGLSRATSEKLRAELAQAQIIDVDAKGRMKLTNYGAKCFSRI